MAYTYLGTLATDRDKVRFAIQDTVSGAGPKPQDGNFADAELDGLVTVEGTWQRAVAASFETLAAAWRRYPSFSADGLSLQRSNIADGYALQAKEWRARYGHVGASRAGSHAPIRQDGYSTDIASNEE